jgi:L-threonylcarbamoyladenylate synthase
VLIIKQSDQNAIELACQALHEGKIISFASDTVYGIGVDATNFKAVEDLYKIKNRDQNKPIAIFLKDLEAAKKIFYFDEISNKIAEKFLPGKLTLVLKKKPQELTKIAFNLNNSDDEFLGFRLIKNDFIENLLEKFGGILAVSSANLSNQNSATSAIEVKKYFAKSNLALLIDGGKSAELEPSTVVKIFDKNIIILRHGAIDESLILNSL